MRKIPRGRIYLSFSLLIKSLFIAPFYSKKRWTFNERSLSTVAGTKYFVTTSSCRMSFYYTLKAMNLPEGSEVLLTPITIPDMVNAILANGLKPIYVDIDEENYCIDTEDLKEKITENSSAILVTYLCGLIPDMDRIKSVCAAIPVIEDISQNYGARYKGRLLGSWGEIAVGSFSQAKTITGILGGGVWTDNTRLIEEIKGLVRKDSKKIPISYFIFCLTDVVKVMLATLPIFFSIVTYWALRLLAKSSKVNLNEIHEVKKGRFLDNPIVKRSEMPDDAKFDLPKSFHYLIKKTSDNVMKGNRKRFFLAKAFYGKLKNFDGVTQNKSIHWHIPFLIDGDRRQLQRDLFFKGIDTTGFGLKLLNGTEAFKDDLEKTPNAKKIHEQTIFIPIHNSMNDHDMERMANILNNYYEKKI